jgi:hypothetical protein
MINYSDKINEEVDSVEVGIFCVSAPFEFCEGVGMLVGVLSA